MTTQITLPHLGENIESGDVLSILVSEGDTVAKDQDLLEIETDKATMPVPSPEAGKIIKLLIGEGDTIAVGAAILEIEPAEATASSTTAATPATAAEPEPPRQESPVTPGAAADAACSLLERTCARMSSSVKRPEELLGCTRRKSTPSSRAKRRTAGPAAAEL